MSKRGLSNAERARMRSPFTHNTIPQVAARLGMSGQELRRACNLGEVKTFDWNGRRRISREEEARLAKLIHEQGGG